MSVSTLKAHGHFYGCATEFRISAGPRVELPELDSLATVQVNTGACGIQTYLTANECKHLASALLEAAVELQALEAA